MIHLIAIVFTLTLMALPGCAKPFQPVPPTFKLWQKPNISEDGIKKAMLECGYPTPFEAIDRQAINGTLIRHTTNDEIALMELCMEQSGFVSKTQRFCDLFPRLEACQSDNVKLVPKRDISRRLGGAYCVKNKNTLACK